MSAILDPDTVERLRGLPPRRAFQEAKDAIYRTGAVGSDDFLDVCEQLVDAGILTWDQIEDFQGSY
jgi:hypothetical protein